MESAPPHVLIFEPDPHGHTREWLAHLRYFAEQEHPGWRITFVVAPELAAELAPSAHIDIVPLGASENRLCLHSFLPVSGFVRWWVMRRHLKRSGAGHGVFLSLDHLSLPFALGFRAGSKPISGILFRPSTHYRELDPGNAPNVRERIRDFRKRILYALMLRNGAVRKVLSLDLYFPAHAKHVFARGYKVEAIGDPAFPLAPPGAIARDTSNARTTFLLFGALAERKGILTLLAALREIAPGTAEKISVIIAGRIEPEIETLVQESADALRHAQPALHLALDNRHLPMDELSALIRRCDVVLAPYKRFVGSSGVLLWAANAGKPVITQSYGLLGKLCREHALGLCIDTCNPAALAAAIETAARNPSQHFDSARAATFAASRKPRCFAAALFDAISDTTSSGAAESAAVFKSQTGHASPLR